jgi:hypothetical protein
VQSIGETNRRLKNSPSTYGTDDDTTYGDRSVGLSLAAMTVFGMNPVPNEDSQCSTTVHCILLTVVRILSVQARRRSPVKDD